MLSIRLSRTGRKNLPFFRLVVTEHTKPVKSGYKEVLGRYDPMKHEFNADVEKAMKYISNGAQLSDRVAKLFFNLTKDEMFKKFFVIKTVQRKTKQESK